MALRIATIVIVVFSIASLRSVYPASADDLVVATYEFMHAANDRPLDVRFVASVRYTPVSRGPYRYHYRPSDMLTLSEQAEGAKIISRRRYSSDAATRGKKRYDGIAFDVRLRKFVK